MSKRNSKRDLLGKPEQRKTLIEWQLPRYKTNWREICALVPKYLSDGANGTVIYYIDGTTEETPKRLQWVLDDWLGHLGTGTELLRKKSAAWLGDKSAKRVPLVVDEGCCLLPVKARQSMSKNHGNIGYVVMEYVHSAEEVDGVTTIQLARAQSVTALERVRTLRKNRRVGIALKRCMEEEKIW